MNRPEPELDPELDSLLRFPKAARTVPDEVRERVLARCRALMDENGGTAPVVQFEGRTARAASVWRARGLGRVVVAASIAIVAGAVGAMAALRTGATYVQPAASFERSVSTPPVIQEATIVHATKAVPMTTTSKPVRLARAAGGRDPLAEVELLQRAHAAFARGDFSGTLAVVTDHAHRFPRGPLTEECEALRVESLLGSGRIDEARQASTAFVSRFPRSVLLSRIGQASNGRE